MSENPLTTLHNLMQEVYDYTGPTSHYDFKHDQAYRMVSNELTPMRLNPVGFGPNQHGIAIKGYDYDGDPVFQLGRYSRYGINDSMIVTKDRFRLNWLTPLEREAIAQATFLRYGYTGRQYVWYVDSPDSSAGRFVDDFRARVPYVEERMIRPGHGGITLRTGQRFTQAMNGWYEVVPNDDPKSTMRWKIVPARWQSGPGNSSQSNVDKGRGSQQFDQNVMNLQVAELRVVQEKRWRADERRYRKQHEKPPMRTKPIKIQDGGKPLAEDAAVTAIMANFSVSSPARTEPWRKEAHQEATT